MTIMLGGIFLNYTRIQCSTAYDSRYTYVYMCIMIRVFHFMCVLVCASVFTLTQAYGHRQTTSK